MKGILFVLVLLISFSLFAEAFAEDVCVDPKFSGPGLTMDKDQRIIVAIIDGACSKTCEDGRSSSRDTCSASNLACQEGCEHDEDCINSCGKTYGKCVDACNPVYEKCLRACPRHYDPSTPTS